MLSAIRQFVLSSARAWPLARHAHARLRKRRYEGRIQRFITERTGRADRLPSGLVYEATMRCNLTCEFCYVGDLLNLEGEWRQEMTLDNLRRAFPQGELQVSLTGGEIFMRKDIMSVLDLFQEKGYSCGYLTTNGTIINDERAEALASLAQQGFLKHISVSIDGPGELHDKARGVKGTFERTAAGLRRLQAASKKKGAALRVSINTTVAEESLDTLDQIVDVAEELGVDAIGLNHLMYSTTAERDETLRLIGETDPKIISTFVTDNPGVAPARVREKVTALKEKCRQRNVLFDYRPKVHPPLIESYYTPGTPLEGRCLYPFLQARVSFSGKVFFCPFIRVEVGDLNESTLEEVWNSERYVDMRKRLLGQQAFPSLPPLLQGGAHVTHKTTMPGQKTLLVNPPPINGIRFTRQGRCQEREEVLGTTKPPYSLLVTASLLRARGLDFRLIDMTAANLSTAQVIAKLDAEQFRPDLIVFCSTTPTLDADVAEMAKLREKYQAPIICFGPHASTAPRRLDEARAAGGRHVDRRARGRDRRARQPRSARARSARRDPEPDLSPRRIDDRAAQGAGRVQRLRDHAVPGVGSRPARALHAAARRQALHHRRDQPRLPVFV